MNHDTDHHTLPDETINLLHMLWNRVSSPTGIDIPRDDLRRVAAAVGEAAHEAEMPPERLLVLVKESWAAHPELGTGEHRQARQRVLADVVSLCICEFYRIPEVQNE